MGGIVNKIRRTWNKLWYGTEVRPVKVTVKDLEASACKMQTAMNALQIEIESVVKSMNSTDRSTDSGMAKYARLKKDLDEKHEMVKILQEEMDKQYANIKKMKESRRLITTKEAMTICGMTLVGGFMIALERENPRAIKLAEFIMRLFPMHM